MPAAFDKCVKDYMISELIRNIVTTDTFAEDGKKMKMVEAIAKLSSVTLFGQPIYLML